MKLYEIIFFIVFPVTVVLPTIFILLQRKLDREVLLNEYSELYSIKIDTIKIVFDRLNEKNVFNEYPNIYSSVSDLLRLPDNKYVNISKLKVKSQSFVKKDRLEQAIKLLNELYDCKNKEVIKLYKDVVSIHNELSRIRSPFRYKSNRLMISIQIKFMVYIVKIHSHFFKDDKDVSKYNESTNPEIYASFNSELSKL